MGKVMVITIDDLGQRFTSMFTERVYRLETLDSYDAPNEHEPYRRFLAGEPVDPAWRQPWRKLVTGVVESGRTMARCHVVTEPLTDYVRFSLLHGYPASIESGEDVRIIGREAAAAAQLPEIDYWLFDDSLAARLIYDGAGHLLRVELINDAGELERFVHWRDTALRSAAPLAAYVAEHFVTTSERVSR